MTWYNQILTGLKAVFGMDHEATEQEIHAKITSMKSYDELAADIRATVEQEEGERYGAQLAALGAEKDELQTKLDAAAAELAQLQADVKQLTADAEQLRADLAAANAEVERLKKTPAAANANGATETPDALKGRAWLKNPNNTRIATRYQQ